MSKRAVNKVIVGGETKLDLTQDTVTPQTMLAGTTAHNAAGEQIEGAVAVAPASNTTPSAPADAGSVGTEEAYARGDHAHPKECFEVVFTASGSTYSCDKTYAEIRAAVSSGKLCYGVFSGLFFNMVEDNGGFYFTSTQVDHNGSEYYPKATIQSFCVTNSGVTWRRLYVVPQALTGTDEDRIVKYDHTEGYLTGARSAKDYLAPPNRYTITLSASAWNRTTKQLSLTTYAPIENGDATTVEIHVAPVDASYNSAWNTCGIMAVEETFERNTVYIYLTFQCSEIPTEDVQVYITTYGIGLKG